MKKLKKPHNRKKNPKGKTNDSPKKSLGGCRYIIVTGGVCSSLGKGIATASIGAIMKACGFKIFVQKLDPYLNVDPGTMNPFQHGEVFVTDDGAETDLDLGHYERFIDEPMSKLSTVTTGQVYQEVLRRERLGEFLGGTIQVVPHITDEIKRRMTEAAQKSHADFMMIEIGGTVGDIEGQPYLEAVRQMKSELPQGCLFHVHVTLLPYLKGSKELKTKPTQHSVGELRKNGLQPDMILARADYRIPKELLSKIGRFCGVEERAVIPEPTMHSIYDVPLHLEKFKIAECISEKMGLPSLHPDMSAWKEGEQRHEKAKKHIPIGLIGKYTHLEDAYLSVIESIKTAAVHQGVHADIVWIDSELLEQNDRETLKELNRCKGFVVPGGFGIRGVEGKMKAVHIARTQKVPYLGLCLGAQLLVLEFARAKLKDKSLSSEEFDEEGTAPKSKYVVHFLPGQYKGRAKGGTLRLGTYTCRLLKGTKAFDAYGGVDEINERHRHRYEFNSAFKKKLEDKGLLFSGIWDETGLAEIVELHNHPFMLGCQFHPEFKSRPHRPHPLFAGFMKAVLGKI